MPEIVAFGEALIEFLRVQDSDEILYRQGFGGDTSNTAIAAARQGASVGYITAIGGDDFGRDLLGLWTREKVATDGVKISELSPTGAYFVRPHTSGRNFSYARRGSAASLFAARDLPTEMIQDARIFHSSALTQAISPSMRDTLDAAIDIARNAGTLVSYDTNLRLNLWSLEDAKATITSVLSKIDILFPSDDEVTKLTGLTDPDAMLDYFLSFGIGIVALKRGAEGAIVATPRERHVIAPAPSTPVDSTGAGDSYAGAFLAYYLETGDVLEAGRRAAIVAAGTVSGFGAVDPISYRQDLAGA